MVYFFLTFAIGYIDFDRRVMTFDESTENLKLVAERNFNRPMIHRLLIPYTLYYLHKISHIPLQYVYAFFRFLFYFLAFCLFHIYLRKWFDDKLSMIGTLSMIASLPLTLTNWYSVPTDMPELITFILGTMWIRDKKYKLLYFLIPIATFNKETTIALVLLYFLHAMRREERRILLRRSAAYFLLWLVPYVSLLSIFGGYKPFPSVDTGTAWFITCTLKHNWQGLLAIFKTPNPYNHFYFKFYLCGF